MGLLTYFGVTSKLNQLESVQKTTQVAKNALIDEGDVKHETPQILKDIQVQLSERRTGPRTRSRYKRPADVSFESPTKKKIFSSIAEPNFASPPPTPQTPAIQKPKISLIRSASKSATTLQSPKRILELLPTPPSTPINENNKQALAASNQTDAKSIQPVNRKLDFSNKENVAPEPVTPPITSQHRPKTIYSRAKAIFNRSYKPRDFECLPEREMEASALKEFFIDNITQKRSTSLYISGPPGTGKTAQINLTLSQFFDTEGYHAVKPVEINGIDYKVSYTYINCMTVPSINRIFAEIYTNLCHKKTSVNQAKDDLLSLLSNNSFSDMNIIVLDELDKLITEDQQVLFELFAWTILKKTNIMLIGISNALDMVDRLLPRLKTNGLNPNTLVFMPYTADQIASIIRSKLRLLNSDPSSTHIPLFHPSAIQLCAKKSASNSGDLRRALDICRNAIDLVERGLRCSSPTNQMESFSKMLDFDEFTAPQVKITHIAKVCSNVFQQNHSTKLKALNLQQKIMLCMLVKAEEDNPFKSLDMNSYFEYYIKNSKSETLIGVLNKGEFLEIVSNMESIGVLRIANTKSGSSFSNPKVASAVVKKDLSSVSENIPILEQIINGSLTT